MIFCRYCGASLVDDSVFCAKCGRKLVRIANPRIERIVQKLYLRTPYPYAALLVFAAVVWLAWPSGTIPVDYSSLKWTLQQERKLDLPDENLFQQGFSLVMENAGSKAVREVPVEFIAHIEPKQSAEVVANFLGQRVAVMSGGKPLPWTVILSDEVAPGTKRNFSVEGSIQANPPFKVTYELREENSDRILASYVVQR